MPIYEYECEKCGAIEETLQKFSDKPLTACKHCSGKLHKLISHSAFHLKGSGWYVTDYAGKKQNKTQQTESKTASDKPDTSSGGSTSDTAKSSTD